VPVAELRQAQPGRAAAGDPGRRRPVHVVLAGGGTAGHIEPALAVADALRRLEPAVGITLLGTARGLETTLVPARGYALELIPPVPLPRRPTLDLARVPVRAAGAVRAARAVLARVGADVLVGFGGYVAFPGYLAARARRTPVVVHEANARPGLANRVGARVARAVAVAVPGTPLPGARHVGMPLRSSITTLNRLAMREQARAHFGLDPVRPTLLVFGGSQGARRINQAAEAAAPALAAAGVQVLHAAGRTNTVTVRREPGDPPYVVVPYLERMDLAYAAADLALCRSGATSVAELTAVGLPAVFVPLPIGNGEQRLNALPVVEAGGGLLVADADLSAGWIERELLPVLGNGDRLRAMTVAAALTGRRDADVELARLVLEVAREHR